MLSVSLERHCSYVLSLFTIQTTLKRQPGLKVSLLMRCAETEETHQELFSKQKPALKICPRG